MADFRDIGNDLGTDYRRISNIVVIRGHPCTRYNISFMRNRNSDRNIDFDSYYGDQKRARVGAIPLSPHRLFCRLSIKTQNPSIYINAQTFFYK